MDYAWFILGNGRKGYLERTIASWESNLVDKPKHCYIFDDSGNDSYIDWLRQSYSDRFTIVPVGSKPVGQAIGMDLIFSTMSSLDVDYFLGIEEDWMLFRPISILEIIKTLESHNDILQMRIPRTIWHSEYHRLDLDAGSLLLHHLNDPKAQVVKKQKNWFEVRSHFYFWSHNPSVFHRRVLGNKYPNTKSHEYDFGIGLLNKYRKGVVGFWATNPYDAYITHIGLRNEELLQSLPSLGKWATP
jgi:hypothetical protein